MGDPLLEAYVELKADASNLDAVLDKLPPKVAKSVAAAAKGMKPLQEEIVKQEAALKAFIATLGTITPAALKKNDIFKEMSGKLEGLKGQLGSVRGSIDRQLIGGLDAAGKGANSAGYKLLQFGNIIDDLQYVPAMGLRPIVNNIMQFAPAIGIAMIAVESLVKAFGGWEKILTPGHTKTEAERMEELAKATEHVADAQSKLTKMKRDEAAIDAQRSSQTPEQKAQAEAVRGAVSDAGIKGVVGGLTQSAKEELSRSDPEVQAALEELGQQEVHRMLTLMRIAERDGKAIDPVRLQAQADATPAVKAARDAYQDKLNKAAEKLLGEAENDPLKLQALIRRVEANPTAFPKDMLGNTLASKLKLATPQAIKKTKDEEAAAKVREAKAAEDEELGKLYTDAMKEHEDRRKKIASDMGGGFQKRHQVAAMIGLAPSRDSVIEDLKKQGVKAEDADSIADKLLKAMKEAIDKRVKEYGLEHNVSPEEAKKKALLDARIEKANDADNAPEKKLQAMLRPQMHSIQSFFDKLTLAPKANEMLKVALDANKLLGDIREAVKNPKRAVSRYGNRQG